MLVGTAAPEWAKPLVGQWVRFRDTNWLRHQTGPVEDGEEMVEGFVIGIDVLDAESPDYRTRFWFLSERRIQEGGPGINVTTTVQDRAEVVPPPESVRTWVEAQERTVQHLDYGSWLD